MATHAVPQDVEAEDKLIGFLSLKQFIFTIIGLGFGYLTFFFFTRIHPISALIWLPFTLVFLVLGLYQRKDQPAEVFLLSALGFYLKPKIRIWDQEGYDERVHITAPPVVEKKYTKDFTGEEARGRLANLSLMMDSRGWASKRVDDWQNPQMATLAQDSDRIMTSQDFAKVQVRDPLQLAQPPDQYDERSIVGQQFETKITAADEAAHKQALDVMHHAEYEPPTRTDMSVSAPQSSPVDSRSSVATPPSEAPVYKDQVSNNAFTAGFSTNTLPSINDGARQNDITTAQQADDRVNDFSQPIVSSTEELPRSDDAANEDAISPPKTIEIELNTPHKTEDGSVEVKLH